MRRFSVIPSTLSLLLCLAACVLWIHSYWYTSSIGYEFAVEPTQARAVGLQILYARLTADCWICRFPPVERDDYIHLFNAGRTGPKFFFEHHPDQFNELTHRTMRWFKYIHGQDRPIIGPNDPLFETRRLTIPMPLVVLATALLPAIHLARRSSRRNRKQSGLCANCGYDLRATPQKCPECGTPTIPPA